MVNMRCSPNSLKENVSSVESLAINEQIVMRQKVINRDHKYDITLGTARIKKIIIQTSGVTTAMRRDIYHPDVRRKKKENKE